MKITKQIVPASWLIPLAEALWANRKQLRDKEFDICRKTLTDFGVTNKIVYQMWGEHDEKVHDNLEEWLECRTKDSFISYLVEDLSGGTMQYKAPPKPKVSKEDALNPKFEIICGMGHSVYGGTRCECLKWFKGDHYCDDCGEDEGHMGFAYIKPHKQSDKPLEEIYSDSYPE